MTLSFVGCWRLTLTVASAWTVTPLIETVSRVAVAGVEIVYVSGVSEMNEKRPVASEVADADRRVRLDGDAADRDRVAGRGRRRRDRVRVRGERDERETTGRVGGGGRGLRGTRSGYARAGDRLVRLGIDDGSVDRSRRAGQNACRSLEHERNEQQNRNDTASHRIGYCHGHLSFRWVGGGFVAPRTPGPDYPRGNR